MKIQVMTTGQVSDALRDELSTMCLPIRTLHRTGPWMHVANYTMTFDDGTTATVESCPDRPVYAAHCERHGFKQWIVLQPKHPLKNHRFFFADRKGGEQ